MLLRRIGYRIALQFTAFVFFLQLINGLVFLALDIDNARRQHDARLNRAAHNLIEQMSVGPDAFTVDVPPMLKGRVRIVDALGRTLFSGEFFESLPVTISEGVQNVNVRGERYDILTLPVVQRGYVTGYVQIAESNNIGDDLRRRVFIYLLVTTGISLLTFFVGLFFARRSLKPAEHMMERLEQFTQDASHELRTPLATLNSSLDLALRTKKHEEGLLSAKEDVQTISQLVERLLELARVDRMVLNIEDVDFSQLVEDAALKHRPLALESKVAIETDVKQGVMVRGDGPLLRQVLNNLLSNAVKFSKPEGGTVFLKLTKDSLSVRDTGIGIARDALPSIFDRFFQADASRSNGGHGLGLALVKRIVDLHGWQIDVKSKEGEGSLFTVYFTKKAAVS
jgi:signal transduction histidine kinase